MSPLTRRLLGLIASVGILALVAGVPAALLTLGAAPLADLGWDALPQRLAGPDDGTLVLVVLVLAAWAAWAVMTAALVLETAARIRGTRTPRVMGLRAPQAAATRLVAAAALLFTPVPATTIALAAPTHAAALTVPTTSPAGTPAPQAPPADVSTTAPTAVAGVVDGGADTPPMAPSSDRDAREPEATAETVRYTVKRGDSLWSIARDRLGDGTRYTELVRLNDTVLGGRPDFITPGTVLQLPATNPAATDADTYVVRPGDTLSAIAKTTLGHSDRYPEILDASRHTVQPDGAYLTDPDLIRPGWILTIPTTTTAAAPNVSTPPPAGGPTPGANGDAAPDTRADRTSTEPSRLGGPSPDKAPGVPAESDAVAREHHRRGTSDEPRPTRPDTDTVDEQPETNLGDAAGAPAWLLPGLTGAGAVLAGALLLTLRAHHRTQLRFRRPGQVLPSPPEHLRPVERTTQVAGETTATQLRALDRLLRQLAASTTAAPPVRYVELSDGTATLHLDPDRRQGHCHDQEATPPPPWSGTGTRWTARLDDAPADDPGTDPPYPLLATLGRDTGGRTWLLNFDTHATVRVTGETDRAHALARSIAAELALNPWTGVVHVHTIDVAPEFAGLNPLRLHQHTAHDTGELDTILDELGQTGSTGEHDERHAVLATTSGHEHLSRTPRILATGGTVLVVGGNPTPGDLVLTLGTDGRLRAPGLDLDLAAAGLTAAEASACAAIVQVARDTQPVPAAHTVTGQTSWQVAADAASPSLPVTAVRPADEPAGPTSLLPGATADYVAAAATTAEDIETLAPMKARTKDAGDHGDGDGTSDPGLDADVAAWFAANCPLPRLALLGPVKARTHGDATAVAKRKAYYTELLAYLALHPAGVTSHQVADAFSITPARARTDLGVLRAWLGTNPRTGRRHLPAADTSPAARTTGVPTYQVDDLLVDAALFDRLRARAQARGADGIADLVTALRLVSGHPLDQLRPAGWSWVLEGDRLDHALAAAIVDVAHIVTTRALAEGDLDTARFAAQTATAAAPYDEIVRLDLIATTAAEGHDELAVRQLADGVLNRSDDEIGPIDLPARTASVLRNNPSLTDRGAQRSPTAGDFDV